jgi:hypothetical protein
MPLAAIDDSLLIAHIRRFFPVEFREVAVQNLGLKLETAYLTGMRDQQIEMLSSKAKQ